MTVFLAILLVLAAGAALFMVIRGFVNMVQEGDPTGRRSQEFMRKRVMFQAIAVLIAVILLLVAGSGAR